MKIKNEKVKNESKLKYLIEKNNYYQIGDNVIIEYWYNDILSDVIIKDKVGRKYKVSHNTPNSKIQNAPDETIKSGDVIDFYKTSQKKLD